MFRHKPGFDARGNFAHAREMRDVDSLRAAKRQTHAVQRNWIIAPDDIEVMKRRTPAHVILGMNLKPRDVGMGFRDKPMMRETQPYSGVSGNRTAFRELRGKPGR